MKCRLFVVGEPQLDDSLDAFGAQDNRNANEVSADAILCLTVRGTGMVTRTIEVEKKGIQALKNWLAVRPYSSADTLFLNRYGQPLSDRGVQKLVGNYRSKAGITKKVGCHSLRHTFATHKVRSGVNLRQVQDWLGHSNLNTTQIYVHVVREDAGKLMERSSL